MGALKGMGGQGFSIIELLVVMLIIGVLVVSFGFTFQGWRIRYAIERDTKQIYADLAGARARALSTKRYQFVSFPPDSKNTYYIYDDTYTAPDGNGTLEPFNDLDPATGKPSVSVTLGFTQIYPGLINGFNINPSGLVENNAGVILQPMHIWIFDSSVNMTLAAQPSTDYNCLSVEATRFNIGLWNSSNKCESK